MRTNKNHDVCISYSEAKYLTDKGLFEKVHTAVSQTKLSLIELGEEENWKFKDFNGFIEKLKGND